METLKIKSKKYSWLLYAGVLFVFLYLFAEFLNDGLSQNSINNSRLSIPEIDFALYALIAVVLFPIGEEFIFRGNFFRNKIIKSISLGVLVLISLLMIPDNFLIAILLIPYLLLHVRSLKQIAISNFNTYLLPVLNVALFAFMHYTLKDLQSDSGYFILLHTGLGFLFLFLLKILNFWWTLLAHISYNSVFTLVLYTSLVYPTSDGATVITSGNTTLSYEYVSIHDSTSFQKSKDTIICNACRPLNLAKLTDTTEKDLTQYISSEPFVKMNIIITNDKGQLSDIDIAKLLIDNNLIAPFNPNL